VVLTTLFLFLNGYLTMNDKTNTKQENKVMYGGQAIIEGVMIRGRGHYSMAVRKTSGAIGTYSAKLSSIYTGKLRDIPFIRGVVVLLETMVLGVQVLSRSANMSLEEEEEELSGWALGVTVLISMTFGVGLFFVAPLIAIRSLDSVIESDGVSNGIEGILRLAMFLTYIFLIGRLKDIRRVFEYHGAEHMAVHAYEHGDPLEVDYVRPYPTAHNRCGTAFLLIVMFVAILVFTFIGRPSILVSIASRIVFLPVIAGISYEIIRLSGKYAGNRLVNLIVYPSLALQSLTTRRPDDGQIEVAITAMKQAIRIDEEGFDVATENKA
jgi:uncharacterized protein YqhQ